MLTTRMKGKMLKYMNERRINKPIDVWFDNIKGILELKMGYGMEWMDKLQKRIYPDDAKWLINHTPQFYLALCNPSAADNEFLLTQNAYGVYDGLPLKIVIRSRAGSYRRSIRSSTYCTNCTKANDCASNFHIADAF